MSYKVSEAYEVEGENLKRKTLSCPKCGEGFRLGNHKDRKTCGKCGYTEFKTSE